MAVDSGPRVTVEDNERTIVLKVGVETVSLSLAECEVLETDLLATRQRIMSRPAAQRTGS